MRKTKELHCEGFYLFESRSSSSTYYFETEKEAKRFINYWDNKLGTLVVIYDYLLTEDGWLMLVKIKDEETFLAFWNDRHEDKVKPSPWRILSEQVRQCLSSYALHTNAGRGRSGSFTHSSYKRYYFDTKREAQLVLDKIRNEKIRAIQKKKRFRARPRKYYKLKSLGKGSLLLCSKQAREEGVRGEILFKSFVGLDLNGVVLPDLIKTTAILHSTHSPPP